MDFKNLDPPFKNEFRNKNETLTQFKHRCDRSTVWVRREYARRFGCGVIWDVTNDDTQYHKAGRCYPKYVDARK